MIFLRVSFAQVLWFTRFRTLQIFGVVLGRGSPVLTIVTHTARGHALAASDGSQRSPTSRRDVII